MSRHEAEFIWVLQTGAEGEVVTLQMKVCQMTPLTQGCCRVPLHYYRLCEPRQGPTSDLPAAGMEAACHLIRRTSGSPDYYKQRPAMTGSDSSFSMGGYMRLEAPPVEDATVRLASTSCLIR